MKPGSRGRRSDLIDCHEEKDVPSPCEAGLFCPAIPAGGSACCWGEGECSYREEGQGHRDPAAEVSRMESFKVGHCH